MIVDINHDASLVAAVLYKALHVEHYQAHVIANRRKWSALRAMLPRARPTEKTIREAAGPSDGHKFPVARGVTTVVPWWHPARWSVEDIQDAREYEALIRENVRKTKERRAAARAFLAEIQADLEADQ